MSLMPDNPPEDDSLHHYALDYRTAQLYSETAAAWVRLEAFVNRKIEDAVNAERERCAKLCDEVARNDNTCMGDTADLRQFAAAIRKG